MVKKVERSRASCADHCTCTGSAEIASRSVSFPGLWAWAVFHTYVRVLCTSVPSRDSFTVAHAYRINVYLLNKYTPVILQYVLHVGSWHYCIIVHNFTRWWQKKHLRKITRLYTCVVFHMSGTVQKKIPPPHDNFKCVLIGQTKNVNKISSRKDKKRRT